MTKPKRTPAKKTPDPMTFLNLTAGKWVSQAMTVVAELGIADLLKDGPRTSADIARTANVSEDGVYRLLRALGSVGLFAETGDSGSPRWATCSAKTRRRPSAAMRDSRATRARGVRGESFGTAFVPVSRPLTMFMLCPFSSTAKMPEAAAVFDAAMTSISTLESKAVVAATTSPGSTLWWTWPADMASCS